MKIDINKRGWSLFAACAFILGATPLVLGTSPQAGASKIEVEVEGVDSSGVYLLIDAEEEEGAVKGTFSTGRPGTIFFFDGVVECLWVEGDVAYVTGVITDTGIGGLIGATFMARVDDGSSSGALDSMSYAGPPPFPFLPVCADNPSARALIDSLSFLRPFYPGEDQLSDDPVQITVEY